MKRFFSLFLCLCLSMGVFTISALAAPEWPSDVSIQADGGIVMYYTERIWTSRIIRPVSLRY